MATTLREFINSLEKLSDNGKYDNIRVVIMDCDDECYDIGWYGIDDVQGMNEEYVRTDAFIEKAWDWIEDNILSSNQQDKSLLYYVM